MATKYFPDRELFRQKAEEGTLIPVCRELAADLDTPVSVFLKLGQEPPVFLLESVERGENLGRYSFMGLGHSQIFESRGKRAVVRNGAVKRRITLSPRRDPLHLIQETLAKRRAIKLPGLPPFCGGAVGYLAYDTVDFFEELPEPDHDELGLPDAIFLFTDTMLAFDHVQHKMKVIANAYVDSDADRAYDEAVAKIERVIESLSKPLPAELQTFIATDAAPGGKELDSNFTRDGFMEIVGAAKEHIAAGDAIQIVLSQRLRRKTSAKPFDIYRALRMLNPSPYMFYFNFGDFQLIGSSPEVLVKAQGDRAVSRPIAGTRPRGATEEEDQKLIAELLADPKERAEHVMLVDLARNDLGRVCRYGTVKVPELMVIEKYSHVSHIVSEVEGTLKPGEDAFSLLRASFPAGTVSGAPKIRAMEIIAELEKTKRGPYAGAVGYFDFTGNMDTCITIRTIVMKGDTVYLQAGAGIVADSDPATEYEESMNKMKALERAIAIAEESNSLIKQPANSIEPDRLSQLITQYRLKKRAIKKRMEDFRMLGQNSDRGELFAEMAYCLCTPRTRFETCQNAINELKQNSFLFTGDQDVLSFFLRKSKVRFHNNKAKYIQQARLKVYDDGCEYEIKGLVSKLLSMPQRKARNYLYETVYIHGLGPKESSHFVRNIGHGDDIAILDRYVLQDLVEFGVIPQEPKNLDYKEYLDIEEKMSRWAQTIGISLGELDLMLWSEETGMM